ncbi:GntR family transcriptional regulator [Curtobacterium sp. ISL-83]|uniref:GntR family transcriptional regulator n=1 Tax=Curtobacterium sp. ISL-83 TaxID=2819145 RepID=UPI001BE605CD|nr:GntR family transcriptional regulator [Curtobacterium sp. ISL-83]MBT2502311.1 GntR family transcriptional regulator [Curtobacterium sp. ISL-83]
MPVPKSTVENSPRKLLRDVVLEKMLVAIQDGTLQAGERLNDDELVQWLGVSRTPIREAIAKLVDYGLVEMEANRYTRVASPTLEQYDDAFQMLFGLAELAARWSMPRLDDDEVRTLGSILDTIRAHADAEDRAINDDIDALIGFLVAHSGNELLIKTAEGIVNRAKFVRIGAPEFVFWDVKDSLDAFRAAAKGRDGEAGGAVVRALSRAMAEHLGTARAAAAAAAAS